MADINHLKIILKAVANDRRMQILRELKRRKSMTVHSVARFLNVSDAAASRHLLLLLNAGIITATKRKGFVSYRLTLKQETPIKQLIGLL